jgi:carboxyl-terminal processing protease
MLPANNKGLGMFVGFPDPCLTPGLGPVPYVNIVINAMMWNFSINIWLSGLPALHLGSFSPTSNGDQAGVLHWTKMGQGRHVLGNFRVLFNFLPATMLGCPAVSNNFNCVLDIQVSPSLTNVLLSYRSGAEEDVRPAGPTIPADRAVGHALPADRAVGHALPADLDRMLESLAPGARASTVERAWLGPGVGYLRIRTFSLDVPARVYTEMASFLAEGIETLVLDLRGNPGGELTAFLELAGDFLEPGSVLARAIDADGDETVYRSTRKDPWRMPLWILVDRGTASAAELFAGCLQSHGRAVVAGERTYGKGTALMLVPGPRGGAPALAPVASCVLPDGTPVHGAGVRPDVEIGAEDAERACDAG